ncbi:MAG TPA: hypothetical protein VIM69_14180 [Opitutaceae bacterium]
MNLFAPLIKFYSELPKAGQLAIRHALSLAAGLATAFAVYYVLYRIGLPSKPFIYVSF